MFICEEARCYIRDHSRVVTGLKNIIVHTQLDPLRTYFLNMVEYPDTAHESTPTREPHFRFELKWCITDIDRPIEVL